MNFSTRSIVISGMLGAVAVILGATGLGFIPVPTLAGRATILHIPAIIGGIVEGPVVGIFVGLIFGLYSFLTASSPMAADPVVAIVPRVFIGLFSYLVYKSLHRSNFYLATGLAAAGRDFDKYRRLFGSFCSDGIYTQLDCRRGYSRDPRNTRGHCGSYCSGCFGKGN